MIPDSVKSILIRLVAAYIIVGLLTGCSPNADRGTAVEVELRTDVQPLVERFPLIGAPEQVTWVYGDRNNEGGDRASIPGPTEHYIHAIVDLAPAQLDVIRQNYAPTESAVPDIRTGLRKQVPPGVYETGPELNRAISSDEWIARAYLIRGGSVLLITASENSFAPQSPTEDTVVPPTK